eukprot:8940601-Ditylum_brightwellii.AAC.1
MRWGKRLPPHCGAGRLLSAIGVMVFGDVVFGLGALISAKWYNLTHCAMDGAGTQFCVHTGTLSCLEGCEIKGDGVTTLRGDTNGVMPGEGVTFGSNNGLGAMMDEGLLASGVFGESTLGSGAGGT